MLNQEIGNRKSRRAQASLERRGHDIAVDAVPASNSSILTTPEAAAYLKLGVPTLNRYRLTGAGPRFARISGGAVRYRRSDLDEWLESKLVSSTSEAA